MIVDGLSAPLHEGAARYYAREGLDQVSAAAEAARTTQGEAAASPFFVAARETTQGAAHWRPTSKKRRRAAGARRRGRHRRTRAGRCAGKALIFARRARLGAVPGLVRVAAPVRAAFRRAERHRGTRAAPRVRVVPRVPRVARDQALAARPRPAAGLGLRVRRRVRRGVPDALLQRSSRSGRGSRRRSTSWSRRPVSLLLLEATRRTVGWPMAVLAVLFIGYCHAAARTCPKCSRTRARRSTGCCRTCGSPPRACTESRSACRPATIFVYVLFGALLDRGGGGNYMMQVSFAALGHLRGGPAKVSVVSSALNGMISGSSVSQRRVGRHLHDPADEEGGVWRRQGRRDRDDVVGRRADHAARDGRGGVPDGRVRRHPVLGDRQERVPAGDPVVHGPVLHRASRGAEARHAADRSGAAAAVAREVPMRFGLGMSGSDRRGAPCCTTCSPRIKQWLGDAAPLGHRRARGRRSYLVRSASRRRAAPTCRRTSTSTSRSRSRPGPRCRPGLHFMLPVGVLIWCLMVEELSPVAVGVLGDRDADRADARRQRR